MNDLLNKRVNSAVRLAERKQNLMNTFVGTILQNTILLTESENSLKMGVRYTVNKEDAFCKTRSRKRAWPYYGYHRR